MPTINELKKKALNDLGYSGSISDAEYKWLRAVCSPYKGSIPDMWRYYLRAEGYTGLSLMGLFNKYLIGQGYTTGTLNEKWKKFWEAGGPSGGGTAGQPIGLLLALTKGS